MRKPSKIKEMVAKTTKLLLPGFGEIMWFGTVYFKNQNDADEFNKSDTERMKRIRTHETTHLRQAESTGDSWLKYYTKYIWQWICNIPLMAIEVNMAYKFIPFELEAYANQINPLYVTNGPVYQWKEFKKLTLKEKKHYAKLYKIEKIQFTKFINDYIVPYLKNKREVK